MKLDPDIQKQIGILNAKRAEYDAAGKAVAQLPILQEMAEAAHAAGILMEDFIRQLKILIENHADGE